MIASRFAFFLHSLYLLLYKFYIYVYEQSLCEQNERKQNLFWKLKNEKFPFETHRILGISEAKQKSEREREKVKSEHFACHCENRFGFIVWSFTNMLWILIAHIFNRMMPEKQWTREKKYVFKGKRFLLYYGKPIIQI